MKRKGMFRYSRKEICKIGKIVIRKDVKSRGHKKPKIRLYFIANEEATFIVSCDEIAAYFHQIDIPTMQGHID